MGPPHPRREIRPGKQITLSLLRDGKPLEIEATLTREEETARLVPDHLFDSAPNYLRQGRASSSRNSRSPSSKASARTGRSRAPLNLLDAYENPEKYQDSVDRIVFLSGVIPTPATVGYEGLRNLIVNKVNGKDIKNMKSLIAAFDGNSGELHSIEFER